MAQCTTEDYSDILPDDTVYGTLTAEGNCDDYSLEITQEGTLRLLLTMPVNVDYDITLYIFDGGWLNFVETSEGTGTTEEIIMFVQPGEYDVEVYCYSGTSTEEYSLVSEFTPSTTGSEDDAPNYWLSAQPIQSGVTVQETISPAGDIDWFKITMYSPGTLFVTLTDIPWGTDYDVYVFNYEDDNAIGSGDNYNNAAEYVEIPNLPAGDYYIRIDSYFDHSSSQPYSLTAITSEGPAVTPTMTGGQAEEREWTVMVYLDGDNNLEEFAISDINEMEKVGSSEDVNVVVQLDRIPANDRTNGNWDDTRRFYVTQDYNTNIINSRYLGSIGEADMASAMTLRDFINWAAYTYPARHYALVLWDHGAGWEAMLSDDTDNNAMTMLGLTQALKAASVNLPGGKLDMIVFDACLMANLEVFQQVSPYADVAIASEELVPGEGLDYQALVQAFVDNPTAGTEPIARDIVDGYQDYYENMGYYDLAMITMSAVDLNALDEVVTALDNLAGELIDSIDSQDVVVNAIAWGRTYSDRYNYPSYSDPYYIDLYDFASNLACVSEDTDVGEAAESLMIAMEGSMIHSIRGSGHEDSFGISISLTEYDKQTMDYYKESLLLAEQTRWEEFMESFYEGFHADTGSPRIEEFLVSSNSNIGPSSPTSVSATIRDSNLLTVDLAVYMVTGNGELLLISSDRIDPTTTQNCGDGTIPLWERVNDVTQSWDGNVQVITDGHGGWAYAYYEPMGAESPYYVTSGMVYWDGQSAEADLIFDIETGEIISVWLIDPWYDSPYEVYFEPGDEFVPNIYRFTSPEDDLLQLASSRSWNRIFIDDPDDVHLEMRPLSEISQEQHFYIGLHAWDFSDNMERQLIDVSMGDYTGPPTVTVPTGTVGEGGTTLYNAVPITGSALGFIGMDESVYYTFTADENSQISVTLYPQSGDCDVFLYDLNGNLISYSQNYGTTPDDIQHTAPYTGVYFIEVWGYEPGQYQLAVGGSSGTAPTPTGLTTTTPGSGTNFYTASVLTGSSTDIISYDRSHYYAVLVNEGDHVTVSLQPQDGDQDIFVYDMFQRLQGKSENYGTTEDTYSFTAAYTGTYFIEIWCYVSGSYSVSVQGTSATPTATSPAGTISDTTPSRAPGFELIAVFLALLVSAAVIRVRWR